MPKMCVVAWRSQWRGVLMGCSGSSVFVPQLFEAQKALLVASLWRTPRSVETHGSSQGDAAGKGSPSFRCWRGAAGQADYHGVLASMRAGNQVVQAIKSHLQLRGMWDPEATNEKKAVALQPKDETPAPQEFKCLHDKLMTNPLLQVSLHRNSSTWKDVPPRHLLSICGVMEKNALHASLLKKFYCRGAQRLPSRGTLMHFIERGAERDPSAPLDSSWLYELVEQVVEDYIANGRPLMDFQHPADWKGKDAVFKIEDVNGKGTVVSGGCTQAVLVKDSARKGFNIADYFVENPHSCERACIRCTSDKRS